jgi:hypothetical protein
MTAPVNAQTMLANQVSAYPVGAVPTSASSANVANATAAATLAAVAGKTTYVTGFSVTGAGATAGLPVTVTLTGVVGGPLNFTYCAAVGALVANTPLVVVFPEPIPAAAVNTAITVSCPALGAGNTNNTATIYGFAQ